MSTREMKIAGKRHTLVVLKITSSNAKGQPATAMLVYPEDTVSVTDGAEFVTAWLPSDTVKVRS